MSTSDGFNGGYGRRLGRLTLALAVVALLGVSAGLAQRERDVARGNWWRNPQVVERLGLSDEQVRAIDEIAFESGQRMIELRARKDSAQLELSRLLREDSPDRGALERVIERLERTECEITAVKTRSRVEIALSLDADQRELVTSRSRREREGMSRRRAWEERRWSREQSPDEER